MCYDDGELSDEQKMAIDAWRNVRFTVLRGLLADEEASVAAINTQIAYQEKQVARLTKSIAELDDSKDHTQVVGSMQNDRFVALQALQQYKDQLPTVLTILQYLSRLITSHDE